MPEARPKARLASPSSLESRTRRSRQPTWRSGNRTAPLTLFIEDPNGNALRLVHVGGEGWSYASGRKAVDRGGDPLQKTALSSTTPSQGADAALPTEDVLTVFIDGPSGFTYVWLRDAGWKFVGRIADGRP